MPRPGRRDWGHDERDRTPSTRKHGGSFPTILRPAPASTLTEPGNPVKRKQMGFAGPLRATLERVNSNEHRLFFGWSYFGLSWWKVNVLAWSGTRRKRVSARFASTKWFFGGIFRVKLGSQNGTWNPGLCLCWNCVYLRELDRVPTRPCPRVEACVRRTVVGRTDARLRAGTVARWRVGALTHAKAHPAVSWAKQKDRLVTPAPLGCGLG